VIDRATLRVMLVGSAEDRAKMRGRLGDLPDEIFHIAGEFPSLAAARAAGLDADAILSVPRSESDEDVDEPLTPREIEVVDLLAEGLSNKAIAARLGISDQTVKFHVSSICGKLAAANRTDAVRRAIRRGLVSV
jgi:DNA-binding NarL/FixJ family response regulator